MNKLKNLDIPKPYKMQATNYAHHLLVEIDNIEKSVKNILKQYDQLWVEQCRCFENRYEWNQYEPVLVKKIGERILQGYNLDESLKIVAYQYDKPLADMRNLWNRHACERDVFRNYALKFLVFTLRQAGFNISDIARIAHIGRTKATKILKEDFIP